MLLLENLLISVKQMDTNYDDDVDNNNDDDDEEE